MGLNTVIIGGTPNTLQASEVTLGELFKSQGYATAYAGKWHLGLEEQSWPTRQGFDEYHVGVIETSDGTLYRESMERSGMPESFIEKVVPRIYESDADGNLKAVREYTVEYRHQVEGDIAAASVEFIQRQAKANKPFFMFIGWTHSHYPSVVPPEFEGKSSIGPYGDAIMELDYRTGQVLDAIEAAGVEDNTIVIWISDNAATPISGPPAYRGGNNGPFRGELGDALEGSIRVPGMIKWPGKITPRKSIEMVSIHDFFPTLAAIIGAEGARRPCHRRRGSERLLPRQAGALQPRAPDHVHRERDRGGALAPVPDLPEGVRLLRRQSRPTRSRRPPGRDDEHAGDLQHRVRPAGRGQPDRLEGLGLPAVHAGHRRVPEVTGEVPEPAPGSA